MKSPALFYSQQLPEAELIHPDLEKFIEEAGLIFDLVDVSKLDFHPGEAGTPDQKTVGFNDVVGRSLQPERSDKDYTNRQGGCHVRRHKLKILSFRSKDPHFKTDPGVLPTAQQAKQDGIDIIKTNAQHTDLSDRGPDSVKENIQATLDHFLSDSAASELAPANSDKPLISNAGAALP
jgi:hypothetical protein